MTLKFEQNGLKPAATGATGVQLSIPNGVNLATENLETVSVVDERHR
jgi:hypothetical protein